MQVNLPSILKIPESFNLSTICSTGRLRDESNLRDFESVLKSGFNGEIKETLKVINYGNNLIKFKDGLTWDVQNSGLPAEQ